MQYKLKLLIVSANFQFSIVNFQLRPSAAKFLFNVLHGPAQIP